MKRWLASAIVAFAAVARSGQEPYPGQSEHKKPPDGWHCTHDKRAPAAHQCACKKTCVPATDEEGNPTGGMVVQEDQKCTVWCHKDHCTCEIKCGQT